MKRPAYPIGLALAARQCNVDLPRTPYAAAKEAQCLGLQLVTRGTRQYIVRIIGGEGLSIVRNARSWLFDDGRAAQPRSERVRDAEFARIVAGAQL